jgi:PKHD-type hydroxylase
MLIMHPKTGAVVIYFHMSGIANDNQGNRPVLEGRKITAGRLHYWVSGTPIFSPEQLEQLKSIVDTNNSPALVEGDPDPKKALQEDARRTRVCWLTVDKYRWVYEIIWSEANKANALFRFDLVPMRDTIQLARYDAAEKGFFQWHTDTIPSDLTRKISITVPLNDSSEYEGGVLEFNGGGIQRPPQIAGAPIMFPSWLLHRVTEVISGKRYSLVAWIRGPNWR